MLATTDGCRTYPMGTQLFCTAAVLCTLLQAVSSQVTVTSALCSVVLNGSSIAPSFNASTLSAVNTTADSNSDVISNTTQYSLICLVTVSGSVTPSFRWMRNSTVVKAPAGQACGIESSMFTLTNSSGTVWNTTLVLCNAERSSAGVYTLSLNSSSTALASLSLYAPPLLTQPQANTEVFNGESVSVQCTVTSYPAATITWQRNGQVINDARFATTSSSTTSTMAYLATTESTLTLTGAQYSDRDDGPYRCVASNRRTGGEVTLVATVNGSMFLIRVRDKVAVLWPILGMMAQAAVLVVIMAVDRKNNRKLNSKKCPACTYSPASRQDSEGVLDNVSICQIGSPSKSTGNAPRTTADEKGEPEVVTKGGSSTHSLSSGKEAC